MAKPRLTLPQFLSFLAGYVDTAGFLALAGLFAAHVTGNFVTLGAALAIGGTGVLAKLLALPVFCAVIFVSRLASFAIEKAGGSPLPIMFGVKFALLALAAVIAVTWGPFTNADSGAALATGMLMVGAMAIQNAAHRIHLSSAPPTTMVTGTTTQIMIDLADLLAPGTGQDDPGVARRLSNSLMSVLAFAAGCAAAAGLFAAGGVWCLAVPPLLVIISFGWAVRIRATGAGTLKAP